MLGVPLVMWLLLPPRWILPVLWLMALVCYGLSRLSDPTRSRGGWNWQAVNAQNLKPVLLRFAVCVVAMFVATLLWRPELLFSFVRAKPAFWALVMVMYPLISVVAQEIIYRRYVWARFEPLIGSAPALILISGLGFGLGHIVFDNWVAPALCAIGGVIFSHTYHKTRSLALVTIEHALYGDAVFTIGLGRYFYHGAVGAAG